MEKFDPAAEKKVWQRVAAPPGQSREDLRPLILSAWEAAWDYRFVMNRMKGPAADRAKQLWEGAQETILCLKGLQMLRGGALRKLNPLPEKQLSLRRVLEQSYHRCRRMAGEFTARSADAECGMVFLSLARREQEACAKLAWLLGRSSEA